MPFAFQREAWQARMRGESGMIICPTGAGKTYAAVIGALGFAIKNLGPEEESSLRIIYITPLKAVARDIRLAIETAAAALDSGFRVEDRTGDTSAKVRAKQKLLMPEILITTPESLALLLCDPDHARHFRDLESVILDEWHECLATKRGSLLELSLTRLRALRPELATWALTATIDNVAQAASAAVGTSRVPTIIRADLKRPVVIESLIPREIEAFPWAGRLGLRMLDQVLEALNLENSTLIFTNTRAASERWYQAIREAKPEWEPVLALHHGSIDSKERERVENGVKNGAIKIVVCTSSLDLGVDFGPVDRILQIGSPKGIARLMQRAGRANHRPGESSQLTFVPTHALELLEIAACREAIKHHEVEPRHPIHAPLDVLIQHLVTRAIGGGFRFEEILTEIRDAASFVNFSAEDLTLALAFLQNGGMCLQAYPEFHRVVEEAGVYRVRDARIARIHRMNIGTIVSDSTVALKFQRGKAIGFIDESFISKLKRGDRFLFSGRVLQYLGMRDLVAHVKLSSGAATVSPTWPGSRLPYSGLLAKSVRHVLQEWRDGREQNAEAKALKEILDLQTLSSALPGETELLVEIAETRQGHHLFVYPFEGRPIHEGMGALLALRLARRGNGKATFTIACNDYGFELLSAEPFAFGKEVDSSLFATDRALEDLGDCLDLTQTARQRFREIARIAGLIHPGHPSARKSSRQLQSSAGLLFDVFRRYEPSHQLLKQAENQVLFEQLQDGRFFEALTRMHKSRLVIKQVKRPTPFAFPLVAERLSARLSTESLADRLQKLVAAWTRA